MTDEVTMIHSCGGQIVIVDWYTEWKHDPNDTLIIEYFCEGCLETIKKTI
jgi:hypothetical protein